MTAERRAVGHGQQYSSDAPVVRCQLLAAKKTRTKSVQHETIVIDCIHLDTILTTAAHTRNEKKRW